MHDGTALIAAARAEPVQLEPRGARALVEALRLGLRQERRLDESGLRAAVVRLQLASDRPVKALLAPILDEDARVRENAQLMAGRELDGPTAELLRKRRGLVLLRMRKRGTLEDRHLRAAGEIREAYDALSITPNISAAPIVQERVDVSLAPSRLTPSMVLDQIAAVSVRRWYDGLDHAKAAPIIAVVVEDAPLHQLEDRHAMRKGSLAGLVRAALDDYCRIAPWTVDTSPIDAAGG